MAKKRAPRGWKKRVKRVLLNVISIGRVCTAAIEAEDVASTDSTTRCSVEVDALRREVQLLREELGLKDRGWQEYRHVAGRTIQRSTACGF